METLLGLAGLFVAAFAAGAVNAVAGGGSLISFPALVAFGIAVDPGQRDEHRGDLARGAVGRLRLPPGHRPLP